MRNFIFLFILILILGGCKSIEPDINIGIALDSTQMVLGVGESRKLTVKLLSENLEDTTYNWSSSSPTVASVDNNGIVTTKTLGTTQIKVTIKSNESMSANCTITVKEADGSSNCPYLIYTVDDLIKMRDSINNNNSDFNKQAFKLMSDLDLKDEATWIPIGNSEKNYFSGIFDGNGKIIKNIQIGTLNSYVEMDFAGLFGYSYGGRIKNLSVQWAVLSTYTNEVNSYGLAGAGGIIGYLGGGDITNCSSNVDISASRFNCYDCNNSYSYAGGIVGRTVDSDISNCTFNGNVSGATFSGGIAGFMYRSNIWNCSSVGKITDSNAVGGILGQGNTSTITNCHSEGTDSAAVSAGGIIGYSTAVTIDSCYSKCYISAIGTSAGGIAGSTTANISNCHSEVNIVKSDSWNYGTLQSGGIAGISAGDITNCYSIVNIYRADYAGGIAGKVFGNIINSYSKGSINLAGYVGGITGISSKSIINSYSRVNIANGYISGGIVGGSASESILNCYSTSNISVFSDAYYRQSYAGGIAGNAQLITNCIALNDTLIAANSGGADYANAYRIGYASTNSINNYALGSMVVKTGRVIITSKEKTSYNDIYDGVTLSTSPQGLLNNYILSNPTFEGITLLKWTVKSGVNDGYPIFEE